MENLLHAFGLDLRLLIIQAVNFGLLLIVLWYFLYKPVLKVLDDRQKKVAQCVLDAEEASKKLESADAEVSQKLQSATKEAEGLVENARTRAKEEQQRLVKEAQARAERLEKDAELKASEIQASARKESEKEIARLAVLAAGKVLSTKHD